MLSIGSLFSGIGGLELGLEWAGLGPVVWQCEIDPFCRSVLEKHWSGVERFNDVTRLTNPPPVDLICGGFPCQDISPAGTGAGLAGKRSGLWREFHRIVSSARPTWVVVENSGGAGSRWVDHVSHDLEKLGYEILPCPLTAWGVGAAHIRSRVFLLAYSHRDGVRIEQRRRESERQRTPVAPDNGASIGSDADSKRESTFAIDAEVARPQGIRTDAALDGRNARVFPESGRTPGDKGARSPDGRAFSWGFEPDLVRAIHGIPHRVDRVAALGNAVVPQCAEVIGHVIRELAGLHP